MPTEIPMIDTVIGFFMALTGGTALYYSPTWEFDQGITIIIVLISAIMCMNGMHLFFKNCDDAYAEIKRLVISVAKPAST